MSFVEESRDSIATFLAAVVSSEAVDIRDVHKVPFSGLVGFNAVSERFKKKMPALFINVPTLNFPPQASRHPIASDANCLLAVDVQFQLICAIPESPDSEKRWDRHSDIFDLIISNLLGKWITDANTPTGWAASHIEPTSWQPLDLPELSMSMTTFRARYYGRGAG